ncbi:MAG TPA: ABC transporter permease [Gemmatimonadales bacterium]|nr:ABC transporter permease [Gemmatimonadales bacterium]
MRAGAVAPGPGMGRRRLAPYALLAPGVLWLVVFFLVPILALARTSLGAGGAPWWDGYARAFTEYGAFLLRSFGFALVTTLIALLLGYPLAYVMAFRAGAGRLRHLLLGLVILPFFTAFLVRTFAWKTILNDGGPVVGLLGWLHLLPAEGRLLNTSWAVIGGLTYNFLPFMILPIYVSLERIDRRLVEAAQDLYSGPGRAFRTIVFPLSLPGVFAGSLLTFIPASGDFINAELLGGPNQRMIGTVIQNQFLQVHDYPLAAALSFVLMAILAIGVMVYARTVGTQELA